MSTRHLRRLLLAVLALALIAAGCGDDSGGGGEQADCEVGETDGDLAIFNWAEYIDQEELDAFAAEFGVGVDDGQLRLERGHAADNLGREFGL